MRNIDGFAACRDLIEVFLGFKFQPVQRVVKIRAKGFALFTSACLKHGY